MCAHRLQTELQRGNVYLEQSQQVIYVLCCKYLFQPGHWFARTPLRSVLQLLTGEHACAPKLSMKRLMQSCIYPETLT